MKKLIIICLLLCVVLHLKVVLAAPATVKVKLLDDTDNYITDTPGSCNRTAIEWYNILTVIYDEYGNQVMANGDSGCEETYNLETGTYKIIQKMASKIKTIPAERVTEDLNKIIMSQNAEFGMEILQKSNLFLKNNLFLAEF